MAGLPLVQESFSLWDDEDSGSETTSNNTLDGFSPRPLPGQPNRAPLPDVPEEEIEASPKRSRVGPPSGSSAKKPGGQRLPSPRWEGEPTSNLSHASAPGAPGAVRAAQPPPQSGQSQARQGTGGPAALPQGAPQALQGALAQGAAFPGPQQAQAPQPPPPAAQAGQGQAPQGMWGQAAPQQAVPPAALSPSQPGATTVRESFSLWDDDDEHSSPTQPPSGASTVASQRRPLASGRSPRTPRTPTASEGNQAAGVQGPPSAPRQATQQPPSGVSHASQGQVSQGKGGQAEARQEAAAAGVQGPPSAPHQAPIQPPSGASHASQGQAAAPGTGGLAEAKQQAAAPAPPTRQGGQAGSGKAKQQPAPAGTSREPQGTPVSAGGEQQNAEGKRPIPSCWSAFKNTFSSNKKKPRTEHKAGGAQDDAAPLARLGSAKGLEISTADGTVKLKSSNSSLGLSGEGVSPDDAGSHGSGRDTRDIATPRSIGPLTAGYVAPPRDRSGAAAEAPRPPPRSRSASPEGSRRDSNASNSDVEAPRRHARHAVDRAVSVASRKDSHQSEEEPPEEGRVLTPRRPRSRGTPKGQQLSENRMLLPPPNPDSARGARPPTQSVSTGSAAASWCSEFAPWVPDDDEEWIAHDQAYRRAPPRPAMLAVNTSPRPVHAATAVISSDFVMGGEQALTTPQRSARGGMSAMPLSIGSTPYKGANTPRSLWAPTARGYLQAELAHAPAASSGDETVPMQAIAITKDLAEHKLYGGALPATTHPQTAQPSWPTTGKSENLIRSIVSRLSTSRTPRANPRATPRTPDEAQLRAAQWYQMQQQQQQQHQHQHQHQGRLQDGGGTARRDYRVAGMQHANGHAHQHHNGVQPPSRRESSQYAQNGGSGQQMKYAQNGGSGQQMKYAQNGGSGQQMKYLPNGGVAAPPRQSLTHPQQHQQGAHMPYGINLLGHQAARQRAQLDQREHARMVGVRI